MAIIGGGSAGLSALKKLSDLNKSAILMRSSIEPRTYLGDLPKQDPHGRIYNVEDVFGQIFHLMHQ